LVSHHLALVGPTASGKSALALEVAKTLGGIELVSVDSMSVYRGMDLGTAKPTLADRAAVPHHMVDVAEPSEDFSVARFREAADQAIAGIEDRGCRALLVGGSALYLRAVVDRLTIPGRWPDLRAELERDAARSGGPNRLHQRLTAADPLAASRMEPTNGRRVVRALEVTLGSGRPFSSFGPGLDKHPPTRFRLAGVVLPRDVLDRRIAERFTAQMDAGLLDEVRALGIRPGGLSRTARQALGYRELFDHLDGHTTLEEAVATAIKRIRTFARRQIAWFRRDPRIRWFDAGENPVAALPDLLGEWACP